MSDCAARSEGSGVGLREKRTAVTAEAQPIPGALELKSSLRISCPEVGGWAFILPH